MTLCSCAPSRVSSVCSRVAPGRRGWCLTQSRPPPLSHLSHTRSHSVHAVMVSLQLAVRIKRRSLLSMVCRSKMSMLYANGLVTPAASLAPRTQCLQHALRGTRSCSFRRGAPRRSSSSTRLARRPMRPSQPRECRAFVRHGISLFVCSAAAAASVCSVLTMLTL